MPPGYLAFFALCDAWPSRAWPGSGALRVNELAKQPTNTTSSGSRRSEGVFDTLGRKTLADTIDSKRLDLNELQRRNQHNFSRAQERGL